MAASLICYAGAIWWSLAVGLLFFTLGCGLLQPLLQRRRATAPGRPPVSALAPIKSLDPGFERAQASIFTQNYPDYEILISSAEADSPALEAARKVAQAHPSRPCRFVHSDSSAAGQSQAEQSCGAVNSGAARFRHDERFEHDAR